MKRSMACFAERDEIRLRIIAIQAAEFFVVDLQIRHHPTRLTSPAIATQHPMPQAFVRNRIQSQARESGRIEFIKHCRLSHREMRVAVLRAET